MARNVNRLTCDTEHLWSTGDSFEFTTTMDHTSTPNENNNNKSYFYAIIDMFYIMSMSQIFIMYICV